MKRRKVVKKITAFTTAVGMAIISSSQTIYPAQIDSELVIEEKDEVESPQVNSSEDKKSGAISEYIGEGNQEKYEDDMGVLDEVDIPAKKEELEESIEPAGEDLVDFSDNVPEYHDQKAEISEEEIGDSSEEEMEKSEKEERISESDTLQLLEENQVMAILSQPQNLTAKVGETIFFSIEAVGNNLSYKWEYSRDNGNTWNSSANKTTNCGVIVTESKDGWLYRCTVTDKDGASQVSEAGKLTVKEESSLKITEQPQDVTAQEGETVTFTVKAEGEGLGYKWEYSRDGGKSWNVSANKTANCGVTVTESKDGWLYRCTVTDKDGASQVSEAGKLTVKEESSLKITEQPQDWTGSEGSIAYFFVEAEGEELSYQWQISQDNGQTWSNSSLTKTEYSTMITANRNGWLYRCMITDKNGETIYSRNAKLILSEDFSISDQSENNEGSLGETVYMYVQAGGIGNTYQWQRSKDGKDGWEDVTSTATARLARMRLTRSPETVGYYYRCIISNGKGETLTSVPVRIFSGEKGFVTYNEKTYYIQEDSFAAKGQQNIDGKYYYFSSSGVMQTGFLNIDGKRYYYDPVTGEAVTGFITLDTNGKTYYFDGVNGALQGLQKINGKIYFLSDAGIVQYGLRTVDGKKYFFTNDGSAALGWYYVESNHATYYFGDDGAAYTGWMKEGSENYYFYSNGIMAHGITVVDGEHLYFDFVSGKQKTGLIQVGVNNYMYFDKDTGTAQAGLMSIDDHLYYFSEQEETYGVAMSGLQKIGESTYYFDVDTKQAVKGLVTDGGYTYYLDDNFQMVTGLQNINGSLYYFNDSGTMATGLKFVDNVAYYFDTQNGKAVSGWYTSDSDDIYYFDSETFAGVSGHQIIDGNNYYFTPSGRLLTGLVNTEDGNFYYSDTGETEEGFITVSGKKYYVTKQHTLLTGLQTIEDKLYYFNDNGVMQTGYHILNDKRYYFDSETGEAVTGFVEQSNGNLYYFDGKNGGLTGLQVINGNLYYLSASSVVQKGRFFIEDAYYIFDPETGEALSGWAEYAISNGSVYKTYLDPQTHKAAVGLQKIDEKLYYFSEAGWLQYGRHTINGKSYYFDAISGSAYTGWNTYNGYTYYYDGENGRVEGPCVYEVEGKVYYFNASDALAAGMRTVNNVTLYFSPSSGELYTGFVKTDGKIYYFDGMRGALSGLQTIDGNQYYFTPGGAMQFGYHNIDGVKYYFDENTGIRIEGMLLNQQNDNYYLFGMAEDSGVYQGAVTHGGVLYILSANGIPGTGFYSATSNPLGFRAYFDPNTGEQQLGLITYQNSSGAEYTYYFGKDNCETDVDAIQEELETAKEEDGWKEVGGLVYCAQNGDFLKGLQSIEGEEYYFSSLSGAMLTGLRRIHDNYYYFDPETGKMLTGWNTIDNKEYYFDPENGMMKTGLQRIDDKTYYLLPGGGYAIGEVQIGEEIYKFGEDGAGSLQITDPGEKPSQPSEADTWKEIDGTLYYYDAYGNPVEGLCLIDNTLYFFDESGELFTGWKTIDQKTYFFTQEGALSGLQEIDGKMYYFHPSLFNMMTGLWNIAGNKYYFSDNGGMETGWIELYDGTMSYFSETEGILTGLRVIDGQTYYFGNDGIMQTGMKNIVSSAGEQEIYYFNEKGVMQTGLIQVHDNFYYFSSTDGTRQTGWVKIGKDEYYFNLTTGAAEKGFKNIEDYYYFFDPQTGKRLLGIQSQDGKIYCFNNEGDSNGLTYGWVEENGEKYYFGDNGIAATGYQFIDGTRYYFDPKTGKSVGGVHWVDEGRAYAFKAGGGCDTGLLTINGKKYYFYPYNERMAVGLVSIGDTLYYFDPEKGMLTDTTVESAGITYVIDENGSVSAEGDTPIAKLINSGIEKLGMAYGSDDSADADNEPGSYACSGLVSAVFKDIGVDVTATAYLQYYSLLNDGYDAELVSDISEAKPGDLIYLSTVDCQYGDECTFWNEIHHVMIYLGDGKVLESTAGVGDGRSGVMIQDWSENPSGFVFGIVRVNGAK